MRRANEHNDSPKVVFEQWLEGNARPRFTELEKLIGVKRGKLYSFLDPQRYERHRPQPSDFGSLATFLNVKAGASFTADDVQADFVQRGGTVAVRRRKRRAA